MTRGQGESEAQHRGEADGREPVPKAESDQRCEARAAPAGLKRAEVKGQGDHRQPGPNAEASHERGASPMARARG